MDEIEYKLESKDPVLISHAISKLIDSIKKKRNDQITNPVTNIAEFKLLSIKRDSTDNVLSLSVCQALITLVENGLWDISEALSTFASSLFSIKNYAVASIAIGRLLMLDLKHNKGEKTMYPFNLYAPQHPFIIILNQDKCNWKTVLNQITFVTNHRDPQIRENGIEMLRPVFLYVLCNPSLNSLDCCLQPVWQLLIESKHGVRLRTEVLLWSCTTENCVVVNTNNRILELTEKALLEKDVEYCTALMPMIASLTLRLLKYGSDPEPNFYMLSNIIDRCNIHIGNLMLALMAEIITICPAIYLYKALQICMTITIKMSYNCIFFNTLKASILKWMAYPSVLCSDALDMATNLTKRTFIEPQSTSDDTVFTSKIFETFACSDSYVQFYVEIVRYLNVWNSNDILSWLKNMSHIPIDLKTKCKLLLSGLFLQTTNSEVVELCCEVLVDISVKRKSFESHLLSLVLHKLIKSRNSTESKYLLHVLPELVTMKENFPIVIHTLDTLLKGEKQLKYFTIELYLKTLRKEPRCYRFVSPAIIRLMKNDHSWYSNATCARAMKYICENHPEHGEALVPLLSQILNRSTDTNGGTASALTLQSISALCKASITDIFSTWKVLAPKMEKEKRTIVLESLCELFGDVTSYPSSQSVKEYDELIDDIITNLWKYVTYNDVRVIKAALNALSSFRIEHIPLKTLPEIFRCHLVLPAAHATTPLDEIKKPEDVLSYIPGSCWIAMLQKVNKAALSAAGELLISFITEEVSGFRTGIYHWPQGDPQNFKYLPEKSVIRTIGEFLRRADKSSANNHRIIIECLRIFAHRYPKPLPNINWSFLNDTVDISPDAKKYVLFIGCHQASTSSSAKALVENYLLMYKSVAESDSVLKSNEYLLLYSCLEDLCETMPPNSIKPFLETTLEYVTEKISYDDENAINAFCSIMSSYARTIKNNKVHDGNSALLPSLLENLSDKIDLTHNRFESYFTAALELPTNYLERMTSPKVWWDITHNKLRNAIAIKAKLALEKRFESLLMWLNEVIDETTFISSIQTYFLETVQRVYAKLQFEKCTTNWIIDFMTQIQGLLVESPSNHSNKIEFFCNVLFVAIISLSGIDCMLMKQDVLITSENVQAKLFPQALAILSDRQEWKHTIPQIMEWLNYTRTSTVPNMYKFTFDRSLICLRHNPYYKDVWTKYLSIKTQIEI
ncbi:focadhesin [Colletes gigas]|uniref:focadhesin n=1 Tax=Colletes gigas TaxID=935657 RepID=UPI001C9B5D2B|nr:focadhesin [Colletes gigas]XP_043255224.1 focadhesin [Colletes gigas]XP_043255225.1 focadhesin [Colletes gigas]XP_043255226.1 focadhesin [Colletes gigas]